MEVKEQIPCLVSLAKKAMFKEKYWMQKRGEVSDDLGRFKCAASRADLSLVYRLVYVSRVTDVLEVEELKEIGETSITRNERLDVTGVLVVDDGKILQVLEGEKELVIGLFSKISLDPRHKGVMQVVGVVQKERKLRSWSMVSGKESQVPDALREDFHRLHDFLLETGWVDDLSDEQIELLKVMTLFRALPPI